MLCCMCTPLCAVHRLKDTGHPLFCTGHGLSSLLRGMEFGPEARAYEGSSATLTCVRCGQRGEMSVYLEAISNESGQTEQQLKLLSGNDTLDIPGHLQLFCRNPFWSQT